MKQSLRVGLGFYCAGVEKSIFLYNFVFGNFHATLRKTTQVIGGANGGDCS